MDDFLDLSLLQLFEDQVESEEEPEPEEEMIGKLSPYMGNMAQLASVDALIQAMEAEYLEQSLQEEKNETEHFG